MQKNVKIPSDIAVIGYPSLCGGADTELLDQIKLWSKLNITTHIIPTRDNPKERIDLSDLKVKVYKFKEYSACEGLHTLSFCNPTFLTDLKEIRKYAKSTSWANCMCFNFKTELEANEQGLIDYFLYQTKHQYDLLAGNIFVKNPKFIPYHIIPYFDNSKFPFIDQRDNKQFTFGRISRCDPCKYGKDQFEIYLSLVGRSKRRAIVVGWEDRLRDNFDFCDSPNTYFYKENGITQQEFYNKVDVVCMTTRTFENLPRVGFESMSSGSVLVVDNRGGWKTQISNNITGFLCNTTQDFKDAGEYLASNLDICKTIARNAQIKLETDFSFEKSASNWLTFFSAIEKNS